MSGGSSYRVGTYCGYQTGKSVRVVGRIAVFKFVSNRVARFDGFTLSFIFTPKGKFNDASTVSYAFFFFGSFAIPRQHSSILLWTPLARALYLAHPSHCDVT